MRIHSDTLDGLELRKAARLAGVTFTRLNLHNSRKREAAFDVILSGDSPRRQNGGEDMAATWDQWGHFLGTLFAVDADMVTPYYENADHFHWMTGGRFQVGAYDRTFDHTAGHRWEYSGESVTGAYRVSRCKTCPAVLRWLSAGTWAEFVATHA